MTSAQVSRGGATTVPDKAATDLKLETIVIPVSDVDRAKRDELPT